jgi:hypothetical protein
MKLSNASILTTVLSVSALVSTAQAWSFTTPYQAFQGEKNFGCTGHFVGKGEIIDWQNGLLSSCVLRIYNDKDCAVQIGWSANDWDDHILGRSMYAFQVTDC